MFGCMETQTRITKAEITATGKALANHFNRSDPPGLESAIAKTLGKLNQCIRLANRLLGKKGKGQLMSKIHELYGITCEELENIRIEYAKLLGLLRRVKSGEVNVQEVQIENNGWRIREITPVLVPEPGEVDE